MSDLINPDDRERILSYLEKHYKYLNIVVGYGGFSIGVACLGTKHPSLFAWIAMLIIWGTKSYGYEFFPAEINALRNLKKEFPNDEEIDKNLKLFEHQFSVMYVFKRSYPYWVGYFFFCFMLFIEPLAWKFPWLSLLYK